MKNKKASTILKNGVIYTVDQKGTVAQAIGCCGDEIIFVGDDRDADFYADEHTEIIDLNGKMVLPGFIDCHTHPSCAVDIVYALDLNGLGSVEKYLERIRQAYEERGETEFLYGFGWDEAEFRSGPPTKEMLDQIAADIPIVMWDEPYHNIWVNSKALENAGIRKDTFLEDDCIDRDAEGEPTGLLRELATELITGALPSYSLEQCMEGLRFYQDLTVKYGFTSLSECCIYPRKDRMGYPGLHALQAFGELYKRGELKSRIFGSLVVEQTEGVDADQMIEMMEEYRAKCSNDRFSLDIVKIYLDYWEEEKLKELGIAADRAGFRLFMHALQEYETTRGLHICQTIREERETAGDYSAAQKEREAAAGRHAIAHVGVVSQEQIDGFARNQVISVLLPQWFAHIEEYYGRTKERYEAGKLDPTASFFEKGIVVTSGTAYPAITMTPRPLEAIQMGMTRMDIGVEDESRMQPPKEERATLDQMIRSFTINAAYMYEKEDEIGSLETGKKADMVILDRDIRKMNPNEIYKAREEHTIIGGEFVC